MVHELLCVRDSRVDEPDIKYEEKTKKKKQFPSPFSLQLAKGVLPPVEIKDCECNERDNTKLNW